MGTSKIEEFSIKDNRIARYAKALSHPARIAIIKLLLKKQACMCGTIVDELPLSQSTVSQHLKELKNSGLIVGEIEGPRICYCIDNEQWAMARKYLVDFFDEARDTSVSCC